MGRVKYKGKIYKNEAEFLKDVAEEIGTSYATCKTLLWREKKALISGVYTPISEYAIYRKANRIYINQIYEERKLSEEDLRKSYFKISNGEFDNYDDIEKKYGKKNYMDRALTEHLKSSFILLDEKYIHTYKKKTDIKR